MSANYTGQQNYVMSESYKYAATEFVMGKSQGEIVHRFIRRGWGKDAAIQFVDKVKLELDDFKNSAEGRMALGRSYTYCTLIGLFYSIIGIIFLVSPLTLFGAGAIFFGISHFIKGINGWRKYGIANLEAI